MTSKTVSAALLLSVLGFVAGAAASENSSGLAGNRGLSPIISIAQANQIQAGDAAKTRTLGVCRPSANNNYSLDNVTIPILLAGGYLQAYENRNPPESATTTILQQPKHGVLRLVTEADRGKLFSSSSGSLKPSNPGYAYLPDPTYIGKDSATIQVDFGNGLKVNVKYYFQVIDHGLAENWMEYYCGKTGPYWKISSTLNTNGNSTVTKINEARLD